MRTSQRNSEAANSLTAPGIDETADYTAYIADRLRDSTLDDVELRVCPNNTGTRTETSDDGDTLFEYQPGTIWLCFGDDLSLYVMGTPGCERSTIAKPTSSLDDARVVDDHFYYCIYEAYARTQSEMDVPESVIDVDADTVHVAERYHLREILQRAFTTDNELTAFMDLIIRKAEQVYSHNDDDTPAVDAVTGEFGGLEQFVPDCVFKDSTITSATAAEPLAPVDNLVTELYRAAGEDMVIATPIISSTVGVALSNAAENGSNITLIVDTRVVDALNTERYDEHDNITVVVTDTPVPAPIITTGDTAYIASFDEHNKPAALLKTENAEAYEWVTQYLSRMEQETRTLEVGSATVEA